MGVLKVLCLVEGEFMVVKEAIPFLEEEVARALKDPSLEEAEEGLLVDPFQEAVEGDPYQEAEEEDPYLGEVEEELMAMVVVPYQEEEEVKMMEEAVVLQDLEEKQLLLVVLGTDFSLRQLMDPQ